MARDRKSAARERAKPITAKRWRAAGADWQRIEALCFRIEFRSDGFSDKELGEAGAEIVRCIDSRAPAASLVPGCARWRRWPRLSRTPRAAPARNVVCRFVSGTC
jgi:hypothetical protein